MPTVIEPPPAESSSPNVEDSNQPSDELRSQAAHAYDIILTDILSGDLLPTKERPSSEKTLQDKHNFGSRMPIRMALAVLASEGLIAQRARHGFWVVDYTDHDLKQIGAMRADADAMVASFLGARIADGTVKTESSEYLRILGAVARMEELANDVRQHQTVDFDVEMEFANCDTQFHAFIAEATNYTLAARHIHQWRNLVRLYRVRRGIHYTAEDLNNICGEHRQLIDLFDRVKDRPIGIDAQIEHAATSHIANSLGRCSADLAEQPTPVHEFVPAYPGADWAEALQEIQALVPQGSLSSKGQEFLDRLGSSGFSWSPPESEFRGHGTRDIPRPHARSKHIET